jgi:2-C-methyl-D-erythritol 2,4-cyclodiphosphate synthase
MKAELSIVLCLVIFCNFYLLSLSFSVSNKRLPTFSLVQSRNVKNSFSKKVLLLAGGSETEPPLRIGHGFDIHRLIEGTKLVVGGVHIPYHLGADAHSDGDALYHSVVDAILGALALPDIGQLFPDNDPAFKGADSSIFMEEAYKRMTERKYRISNLDVTLILQTPKVLISCMLISYYF